MSATKVTAEMIRRMKGQKIPALTAYDYPMAKLLDEIGIPLILAGDSLGMVVLGYPDTTQVTYRLKIGNTVSKNNPSGTRVKTRPLRINRYSNL